MVSASGSSTAVTLEHGSNLAGSVINAGSLALDNSRMSGDLTQDANTPGTLSLSNGAHLTGTLDQVGNTLIQTGSTFDMVGDSKVAGLRLDGGTVNLRGGNAAFRTFTASGLEGNGTFVLGTDLAQGQGDLVNIEGQAEGNHRLAIVNTGVEPASDFAQRVVHTEAATPALPCSAAMGW